MCLCVSVSVCVCVHECFLRNVFSVLISKRKRKSWAPGWNKQDVNSVNDIIGHWVVSHLSANKE